MSEETNDILKAHIDCWKSRALGYSQDRDKLILELQQERWKVVKLEAELKIFKDVASLGGVYFAR